MRFHLSNSLTYSIAGSAVAIILVFQLLNLTTVSLWHDEAFSGLLVQYEDYGEMLYRIGLDVHPPLYYIILRAWTDIVGTSLYALRSFSLIFGLLTALGTYILAREIFRNRSIALLALFFMLFGSFQIQYNMEARMYTLGTFFIVFSSIVLLKALKTKSTIRWLVYAILTAAAIYTHYLIVFLVFAQGLFILLRRANPKFAFLAFGLIGLSYLPWLPTFLRQLKQVEEAFWIPPLSRWSIPTTLAKMTTGEGMNPQLVPYILIAISGLVVAALGLMLWKYKQQDKWLLALGFFIPFGGAILLSLRTSIYLDRYFIFVLPFLMIILASVIISKRLLIVLAMIGIVISYPVHWYINGLANQPGMNSAAAYLEEFVAPQDVIVVNSSFVYFTFRYYNQTSIQPVLYAPSELLHYSGTALLVEDDTISNFQGIANPGDTVWTIDTTGFGNYQPEIPSSWKKISEKDFSDAYIHRGSIIVRQYIVNGM